MSADFTFSFDYPLLLMYYHPIKPDQQKCEEIVKLQYMIGLHPIKLLAAPRTTLTPEKSPSDL